MKSIKTKIMIPYTTTICRKGICEVRFGRRGQFESKYKTFILPKGVTDKQGKKCISDLMKGTYAVVR